MYLNGFCTKFLYCHSTFVHFHCFKSCRDTYIYDKLQTPKIDSLTERTSWVWAELSLPHSAADGKLSKSHSDTKQAVCAPVAMLSLEDQKFGHTCKLYMPVWYWWCYEHITFTKLDFRYKNLGVSQGRGAGGVHSWAQLGTLSGLRWCAKICHMGE